MQRKLLIFISIFILFIITSSACSEANTNNKGATLTEAASLTAGPSSELTPTLTIQSEKEVQSTSSLLKIASSETSKVANTNKPSAKKSSDTPSKKNIKEKESIKMIAIDAGHQKKGNYEEEPIGPGAKKTKPKVTSGTQGSYSGIAEYELNLTIALKVKEELIDRGYKVYMVREKNNVNLSNKERALLANESGADLFIRIHADSSSNSEVHGVSTLYPSKDNPYVSELSTSSHALSKDIANAICKSTGAKNRGAIARDDMSGINWCKIPVSIIEMGFMSNKKEDLLMQQKNYQSKIVKGICDGIDAYYSN